MAKRTFKIGEYAIGGKIAVEVGKKTIIVSAIDWNRGSVLKTETFLRDELRKVDDFLNRLTSHYFADRINGWIKEKLV